MIITSSLPNGVRVVTKRMPGHRGAALGVWLINGARYESPAQSGYAHFLEHLFFKGTAQLDGTSLAFRLEAMGGQVNAHTGRELMALHGLVPKGDVAELSRIIIDMLLLPRFDDHDVDLERQVILQEMAMIEDTPEETLEDKAMTLAWPDHPLGRPVLGRPETIEGANAAALRDYLRQRLSGGRVWVVAAGDVEHDVLADACRNLASLPPGTAPPQAPPRFMPGDHRIAIDAEQSQLLWVMPVSTAATESYYSRLVANHVLGGGVSSRLFQELRERRGLVYGIQSRLDFYSDGGIWAIQTACDPRRADECREAVNATVAGLLRDGVNDRDLEIARRHLSANLVIDEDHPEHIMERLAREAIYLGHHPDFSERMHLLNSVSAAGAATALAEAWSQKLYASTA